MPYKKIPIAQIILRISNRMESSLIMERYIGIIIEYGGSLFYCFF